MEIRKSINFDLDGTVASLYSVPNWLEKLRAEDPSPYLDADPMCDMKKLADVLNLLKSAGWEINVITWLSMNNSEEYKDAVREAKLAWLNKWVSSMTIFMVFGMAQLKPIVCAKEQTMAYSLMIMKR